MEDEDEEAFGGVEDSPLSKRDNRTSVDGMDPAFANVLRRSASASSLPQNPSPLRQQTLTSSVRGRGGGTVGRRRGGAAFQEARPPSLVGAPEALAMELGIGMASLEEDPKPEKEYVDFGAQTEAPEEDTLVLDKQLVPAPVAEEQVEAPVVPVVERAEFGVQVDPEPVPAPVLVPTVVSRESSSQTEVPPAVAKGEMGIQHDQPALAPPPVLLSVPSVATVDSETQTPVVPGAFKNLANAETQTPIAAKDEQAETDEYERSRRTTITRADLPKLALFDRSGDTTITRPQSERIVEQATAESEYGDDGTATETGPLSDTEPETETENEQEVWTDARQSVLLTSATQSESGADDFQSIMTVTDNDYSDDEERYSFRGPPSAHGASRSSLPLSTRQGRDSERGPASAGPSARPRLDCDAAAR
ncbi:hypothetical protein PUNSTDRAFT_144127 [Punctularia strigosozonata HHB-11173 SS5]|uniref:uncharacterized protein n=1 Tax=Punctularia strigosozonata (strain HHB-11173) TaxID=741275 RepID=UPI0004417DE5|nr:uncharacterized protein PUNSTDRAFT_144127 [Punctularia strigosozonata HHB-11173 SS5]EIN08603.1 hypothetical protein PUNSTDRAFT_144127 [Punctularia strigosozonata HHB-11173 SS5]